MQIIPALFRRIYDTPACVALIPSLAVIIDYTLTFFLAADTGMILQWEASPLVRFAVAHNIMAVYLLAIVLFYYGAAYAVLRILRPTRLLPVWCCSGTAGECYPCTGRVVMAIQECVVFRWHIHPLSFIHYYCILSVWVQLSSGRNICLLISDWKLQNPTQ